MTTELLPACEGANSSAECLCFGDIRMDLLAYRVTRGWHTAYLPPTEYRLLRFREVHSRQALRAAVGGHKALWAERSIDVHIRRLRNSLNAAGEAGYALDAPRL